MDACTATGEVEGTAPSQDFKSCSLAAAFLLLVINELLDAVFVC